MRPPTLRHATQPWSPNDDLKLDVLPTWARQHDCWRVFCVCFLMVGVVLASMSTASHQASAFAGPATIVDGDTLEIGGERVRLEGIDAPETAQTCRRADGREWPCCRRATGLLAAMAAGQEVACDSRGTDKYGRRLAICFMDGHDINAAMVKSGMAWAFVRYSNIYLAEEGDARQARAGVWQGPAEPHGSSATRAGVLLSWQHQTAAQSKGTCLRRATSTTCLGAPGTIG